ncbi:MAG: hypothetical protein KF760_17495 [Candidatus Eremiobacteraeota bacterium]|nr:hypothetical protein [Candidatus Eremiobacteraeota bacterium]MCW5870765.1 hypothetical protein [Candidatus Eremiobacteraeota bacterium]
MRFLKGALLVLGLTAWGQAQGMAESLKSEFHKESELGAKPVAAGELGSVKALMADPAVRIIALQILREDMDESLVGPLTAWVQAGHSLWIYDARITPLFGFQPVMMKKNQFTNKDEKGTLGGRGLEGVGTVALAMGNSAINTGVGQVSAFLPKVNEDEYGAVNVTADTQALLRFTYNSPAVAAYRREGRGLIVFKPLLWPEALSGDRFQSNLLEFSAGFQVPGPAGSDKIGKPPGPNAEYIQGHPATGTAAVVNTTAPETRNDRVVALPKNAEDKDEMEVIGEGTLVGQITNEKLSFETGTASVKLTRAEVDRVELSTAGQLDTVYWRDGHTSKGLLMDKRLEIDVNGESRTVEKKLVKKFRWSKEVAQQ